MSKQIIIKYIIIHINWKNRKICIFIIKNVNVRERYLSNSSWTTRFAYNPPDGSAFTFNQFSRTWPWLKQGLMTSWPGGDRSCDVGTPPDARDAKVQCVHLVRTLDTVCWTHNETRTTMRQTKTTNTSHESDRDRPIQH